MISVPPLRPFAARFLAVAGDGALDFVTMKAAPPPALALVFIAEPAEKIANPAAAVISVLIMPSSHFQLFNVWGTSPSEA